jgi:hypothetical protein
LKKEIGRIIAARFANEPLTKMACGNKFSFAISDYLTAGRMADQLRAALIEAMPSRIQKVQAGNQVLRNDDMASLKNWAG